MKTPRRMPIGVKEYVGQCQYHLGRLSMGLRFVQLRTYSRSFIEYQASIAVCAGCRVISDTQSATHRTQE
jgi:hypothetical protein